MLKLTLLASSTSLHSSTTPLAASLGSLASSASYATFSPAAMEELVASAKCAMSSIACPIHSSCPT